jgi:nitrate/nitrite transporter NarK
MLRRLWSFRDRYRILHLNWFAFFLSFVVWFNIATLATKMQQDLSLTTEQLKVLAICNLALTGGLISDKSGSRKWTMTLLTAGIEVGFLLMRAIDSHWSLPIAIGVTLLCAYFVQAGAGATFSLVPLIKRKITGKIAATVGPYGDTRIGIFLINNG